MAELGNRPLKASAGREKRHRRTAARWFLLPLILVTVMPFCARLAALAQDLPANGVLMRAVMLTRHGVRSPTQSTETLNSWRRAKTPGWPDFDVPPGYLTPKGGELVEATGGHYRTYLDRNGLSDPAHCLDGILLRADSDERTVMTAHALGNGLTKTEKDKALRCRFAIQEVANGVDPLFHPSEARPESCPLDPKKVEEAIGDLHPLAEQFKNQIAAEQGVLQCCSSQLCEKPGCSGSGPLSPSCTLQALPSCADAAKGQASIKGGLGIAQSFAEMMLLRYGQGLPVAFDKAEILNSLRLHVAVFDKVQRAPYVAERQGANLLYHIAHALESGRDPGSPGGPFKFVAYVGHDTNIANLAALLDLHWQLPEYPADDMPPGGALVFELRQPANGSPLVDAFFAAQSSDDMRNDTGAAPERAPVRARRCPPGGGPCVTEDFVMPVASMIDAATAIANKNPGCVTQ
jgi:4-phytase/acid phosphatase